MNKVLVSKRWHLSEERSKENEPQTGDMVSLALRRKAAAGFQPMVVSCAVGFSKNVIMLHSVMQFVYLFLDIVDWVSMGFWDLWPDGHRIVFCVVLVHWGHPFICLEIKHNQVCKLVRTHLVQTSSLVIRKQGQGREDKVRSQYNAGLGMARDRVWIRSKMKNQGQSCNWGKEGERITGHEARKTTLMLFFSYSWGEANCAVYTE